MSTALIKSIVSQTCRDLGITTNDVQLGYGAAMVMYGLRRETSDIDLDIPEAAFEKLKAKFHVYKTILGDCIVLNMHVSVHPILETNVRHTTCVDGIPCYTLKRMLECYHFFRTHPDRDPCKKDQDMESIHLLNCLLSD